MLNVLKITFLCVVLLASGIANANTSQRLQIYVAKHFADRIQVTPEQISQLAWIMDHTRRSFDMDMYVTDPSIHIEVVRALTRLYCLQLLKSGSKDDYDLFISAQLSSISSKTLTFGSFKKLAKHVQKLSVLDYELLETATILSAISLSPDAEKIASKVLQDPCHVKDNLDFLATTIRGNPNMYPLAQQITNNNAVAKKLLYVLFPPQTNFRHMLYTEGGVGMYKYLQSMIKHGYITQDEIDLWYAYWVVNIAGFRGHVDQDGSLYLTEPVYQAMTQLKAMIDQMLEAPNYNPLIPYLEYRAKILGLSNLPQQRRLLLAHIGSLMRLYDVTEGNALRVAFASISTRQQQRLASHLQKCLQEYEYQPTTYLPALFGNTLELLGGDINRTVQVILPIYTKAIQIYAAKMERGEIKPNVNLAFNSLSATKNIKVILQDGSKSTHNLQVSRDGEVQVF